jgi:uncharacterized repeat protein (TIGR03803 family)
MKRPGFLVQTVILTLIATTAALTAFSQTEKVIYPFSSSTDGASPNGVILDAKGNLYGTTVSGGTNGSGAVFQLTPNADGTWTKNEIYSFGLYPQPSSPCSGLTFDVHGNLYGLTLLGGNGSGTVFELSPQSNGTWTETTIHNFTGNNDSAQWGGTLAVDSSGNLYGASTGFSPNGYYGSVFELTAGANGIWSETVLHSFTGGSDGSFPSGQKLLIDSSGNVYGSTVNGGPHDYGVVFELTRGTNGIWQEHVLHGFTGDADGSSTNTTLTLAGPGRLYGYSNYAIYELTRNSNGTWIKTDLHTFTGSPDGANPNAALTLDGKGHIYGTTSLGGQHVGTVFALSRLSQGTWSERILHRFASNRTEGVLPQYFGLAMDAKGNLYGTTQYEGNGYGVVFEIAR